MSALLPDSVTVSSDITPDIVIGAGDGSNAVGQLLGQAAQFFSPQLTINGGALDGTVFAPFGPASGYGLFAFGGVLLTFSLLCYFGWKAVLE